MSPTPINDGLSHSLDHFFKPKTFLIGNHADELTPWVPVLSTIHSLSGYINIPCCAWSFDAKYERSKTSLYPFPKKFGISPERFVQSLNMGAQGGGGSSYSMYRTWLASVSLHCGWEIECEVLRIPSTRNWAVIGRHPFKSYFFSFKELISLAVFDRETENVLNGGGRGHR
jgi:tRNASer (uridine44-2'-O)-methyltransferase